MMRVTVPVYHMMPAIVPAIVPAIARVFVIVPVTVPAIVPVYPVDSGNWSLNNRKILLCENPCYLYGSYIS